ncbi:AAA-ATPase At3g50940-like isoform X2 [Corylus avellana]|uniref:AAA-ATPase At3g50940-like isoform X2 n=1 Tax=Corylus avellana TaxID=13451 RepID=UPI00286B5D3E|nr:AAA-ATPase At3g50940-like isoform X2 [Corylus avellana]
MSFFHSFSSSLRSIPTASSWFEAYVALSTSMTLLQTAINQFIPVSVRSYIMSRLKSYFFGIGTEAAVSNSLVTLTIPEMWENMGRNKLYDAVKEYLPSKISSANKNLRVGMGGGKKMAMAIEGEESIVDVFDNIKLTWSCSHNQKDRQPIPSPTQSYARPMYVLCFDENHREKVMDSYLPHILNKHKVVKKGKKVLKHYTRTRGLWQSSVLEHPATFETVAMEPALKKAILDDLDRFLRRKSFYKKVGKAWKRGYLLYGPPGTGKTSLIAAMANYLKFDVYDLELSAVHSNADLMMSLRNTSNRSILVVEDIDCNREVKDRSGEDGDRALKRQFKRFTLSGLLNSIDGLWTKGSDERIIVFTTNHKDQIDPALLRPGRMDMHINLSFCTVNGFRILASNYLDVQSHPLFEQIDRLLKKLQVTPAVVAEELMKDDDADVVLSGFINFLERKEMGGDGMTDVGDENEISLCRSNKIEIEDGENKIPLCRSKKIEIEDEDEDFDDDEFEDEDFDDYEFEDEYEF